MAGSPIKIIVAWSHCAEHAIVLVEPCWLFSLYTMKICGSGANCKALLEKLGSNCCQPPPEVLEIENNYAAYKSDIVADFPERFDIEILRMRLKGQKIDLKMGSPKEKQILQQRVHDTSWVLQNLPQIIETEVFLQCHLAVVGVKMSGEEWNNCVALWISGGKLMEVEVSQTFLEVFLTDIAFQDNRYKQSLSVVAKYDRRVTFDNTTFRKARKITKELWEVMDEHGRTVVVLAAWATDPDNMSLENQRKVELRNDTEKEAGREPSFVDIDEGYGQSDPSNNNNEQVFSNGPLLAFPNMRGKHHCLAAAVASAVEHCGHPNLAQQIFTGMERIIKTNTKISVLECALALFRSLCVKYEKVHRRKFRITQAEQCREYIQGGVLFGSLRGKKGCVNHVVAFAQDLLFDPNASHPQPITTRNLELACGDSGFNGLMWAVRIHVMGRK